PHMILSYPTIFTVHDTTLAAPIAALWNDINAEADPFKCTTILLEAGARVNQLSRRDYAYANQIEKISDDGGYITLQGVTTALYIAAYFG
ncbi:MAG: hypothetical protein Q9214_007765, partial [Letrouitia sp. 1 TL-2023]